MSEAPRGKPICPSCGYRIRGLEENHNQGNQHRGIPIPSPSKTRRRRR